MEKMLCRFIVVFLIIMGLMGAPSAFAVAKEQIPIGVHEILSAGQVGPRAIELKIRTDKPEGQPLKAGDLVVLHVKASRECYVTAMYVSANGDAVVLLPNSKTPDNLIKPDKEYTLFGEHSGIKLKVSDQMKQGEIVFLATSKPLDLSPLKAPEGQACITIPHAAEEAIGVLKKKIDTLSQDEGFNRIVMPLRATGKEGGSLNLMGLPAAVTSDKPEGITGVQGVKEQETKR